MPWPDFVSNRFILLLQYMNLTVNQYIMVCPSKKQRVSIGRYMHNPRLLHGIAINERNIKVASIQQVKVNQNPL